MQKQGKLKNRKPIFQTKAQKWAKLTNSNKKRQASYCQLV
nr:MAG TPA: hypothetical protein [Caudoviricetes sp.]